ncbi:MFS transporter [Sphingomonas adhaesiva]|uniref:MFS transporter n=1 Tax=Sphingomonas adhaesiva TaxID=28212 RepID=UPI002FF923B0
MERNANRVTARAEWRRGWPLVLGALIGIGAGPGLFQNLSSLFTPGMMAEFGWTRGQIATAAGVGLIGAVGSPFLGRAADRLGIRPVIILCMTLLGVAYAGFAMMRGEIWQYQLLVLLLALGVPGTSSIVYGKPLAACFRAHRGLALGIATSGLSITTVLLPPLAAWVIAGWGWRGGFVALAIVTTLIAMPLALIAIRGAATAPTRPDAGAAAAQAPVEGPTAAETRRDARFWRLGASAFCINLATAGLVTQLVPFGLERGLSAGQAALLLAAFGAAQVVARIAIGALIDRWSPQGIAAVVALLSALGFALLEVRAPGFALLVVLVFFAGMMNGAENDLLPFFTVRLFGLRAYGEIYGWLVLMALAGTATGIVGFGRLYDATGSYDVALGIASGALTLTALLYLSLRERPLPRVRAAAAA